MRKTFFFLLTLFTLVVISQTKKEPMVVVFSEILQIENNLTYLEKYPEASAIEDPL